MTERTIKLSVECILCKKTIEKEIPINSDWVFKSIYEIFQEEGYKVVIEGKDNIVELVGFICKECYNKLTTG